MPSVYIGNLNIQCQPGTTTHLFVNDTGNSILVDTGQLLTI